MDRRKYDTLLKSEECFNEIFKCILAMLVDGKPVEFINEIVSIDKGVIDIFRQISSKNYSELVDILFKRDAFKLNINSGKVLQIVKSVNNLYGSQVKTLLEKNRLCKGNSKYYLLPAYRKYIEYINEAVSESVLSEGSGKLPGVSNELIAAFMDTKAAYLPAIEITLLKFDVIAIEVDEVSLRTCLKSYMARIEGQELAFALIKAGANYPFVIENVDIAITAKRFKNLRTIFSVSKDKEKISVKLGVDVYNDFMTMMKQGLSNVDTYMALHRKYKLRIDTIYLYITSTLEADFDDDDDDLDAENGLLASVR